MSRWNEIIADAPEFAARVRSLFDAGTNKTMATLRFDGSPRISATELQLDDDRVTLGMMPGSRKLADVLRDDRVAIHSPTLEPPSDPALWAGDAKLSGRLVGVETPGDGVPGHYFELDIREVALTRVNQNGTALVIESWHEGRGYRSVERE
jgi:hypothetical protein